LGYKVRINKRSVEQDKELDCHPSIWLGSDTRDFIQSCNNVSDNNADDRRWLSVYSKAYKL